MRRRSLASTFAIAWLGLAAAGAAQPRPKVVDLGHPLKANDPGWEATSSYRRDIVATFDKDGYAAGRIAVDEHFGTHLDAPAHFAAKGWTVDQIPPDRLFRPGIRIDVIAKAAANPDYRVTIDDVKAHETSHGTIPEGAVVFIATGWDKFWPDRSRYMNEKNGVKHFPGLTPEATAFLARERRVAGIGIDTPSIDYGPSTKFEAHHTSMPLNVYHIENARGLAALPASGFDVLVAPIAIAGGSGGPTRVFAFLR